LQRALRVEFMKTYAVSAQISAPFP
jgi:hypothetical protein